MGRGSITRLLFEFGIPATIGLVVNALYNIVDSIFIGRGVGELGLAATAVALPSMNIMMAVGMLVGAGANALLAIRLGESRYEEGERILGHALSLLLIASAAVTVVGLVFLEPILRLSGATPEVMPYAKSYLSVILLGLVFQGIGFGMNHSIRTTGHPQRAMFTMLVGAVVNIFLDYLFIMQFGWGVAGAAWATIISMAISAALVLQYFTSTSCAVRLRLSMMKIQPALAKSILALGLASFAMQAATSLVTIVLNNGATMYGAATAIGASNALAIVSVISRIGMFFIMPVMGFLMAAQPIIGFNYGARNFDRVKATFRTAVLISTAMLTVFWAVIQFGADGLVGFFGITSPGVADFAALALRVDLVLMPLIGFQMLGSAYFQSTGQPFKSGVLSLSRQVLFLIPALVIVPLAIRSFGGDEMQVLLGLMIAYPLSDFLASTLTAIYIRSEMAHLDDAHARTLTPHDLDADGQITIRDYEEVAFIPPSEI